MGSVFTFSVTSSDFVRVKSELQVVVEQEAEVSHEQKGTTTGTRFKLPKAQRVVPNWEREL